MVCKSCKTEHHFWCDNLIPSWREDFPSTWCDCQHRTDVPKIFKAGLTEGNE